MRSLNDTFGKLLRKIGRACKHDGRDKITQSIPSLQVKQDKYNRYSQNKAERTEVNCILPYRRDFNTRSRGKRHYVNANIRGDSRRNG